MKNFSKKMKITKYQLKKELKSRKNRKFNFVFIGMSGSGKTYWSKKLVEKYFLNHVEFDELIGKSKELISLIKNFPGKDSAEKLGNYFGKPWNKDYKSKENRFLIIEKRFLSKNYPLGSILDLTGSSIYHPDQMEKLMNTGLIIYLESSKEAQKEMFRIFMSDPKPICWNGLFRKKRQESNEKALKRCYPMLLQYRAKLYGKYADVNIPFKVHKNTKNPEEFIELICEQLN